MTSLDLPTSLEDKDISEETQQLQYVKKTLLAALRKAPTYSPQHPLIPYIEAFDKYLGSSQIYSIDIAERLGFDYSLERYTRVDNIFLREVIYYEFLNYILYAEPNLSKAGFPPTGELINITELQFKLLFEKYNLAQGQTFAPTDFRKRLSLITDYFLAKIIKT